MEYIRRNYSLVPRTLMALLAHPLKLASLLIFLSWIPLAHANYYCTGKVRYLGTDNALFVSNRFGVHRKFVRQVDAGETIGVARTPSGLKRTSLLTVITNRSGDIINVYPGELN